MTKTRGRKKPTRPAASGTPARDARHGYPRPQLQRDRWTSLNGDWDFAIDPDGRQQRPEQVGWKTKITVPFAPETPASGVADTGLFKTCWYRRTFEKPGRLGTDRLILHFGAVDYAAAVWVNGRLAARHEGGYTPFHADITDLLSDARTQTIIVRADDDPHDMSKPRGKQDWKPKPHSIWYWRTSGIWQSVWLEQVPANRIESLRWTPGVERWEIDLDVRIRSERAADLRLRVRLRADDALLADDEFAVTADGLRRTIALDDPGIGDARKALLWSPESPNLIDAELELLDPAGKIVDAAASYTAMRAVRVERDRFLLNGRPCKLRMALDQGYWPDSGLTAPDDDALRRDVELAREMGFNGVRKHQKIEDPRYLYWADRLGLLVWEEMPSAYAFNRTTVERVTREWTAAIERDASHPCIVAWVPFNESWGVPDLPVREDQRNFLRALYHLTRTLDPTRPVIDNDGWESTGGDILGVHDYSKEPSSLTGRYAEGDETLERLLYSERRGGRVILLDGYDYRGQPFMLTEFGGIAFSEDEKAWGYARAESAEQFERWYADLLEAVNGLSRFAGFCYTQFTDTYQEANGLLYMDRTPKVPLERIAAATRG